MDKRLATDVGEWWKFDQYEIRDGLIRPAEGARFEKYDPWANHNALGLEPPWLSLFNLADLLASHNASPLAATLTSDGEDLLLKWCAEYGLLGVLCHETLSARLWPRWMPDGSAPGSVGYPMPNVWWRVQSWYSRRGPGWVHEHLPLGDPVTQSPDFSTRFMTPVERGELPPHMAENEFVTTVDRVDPVSQQSLSDPVGPAWGPYFPDVPHSERETFPYPMPLSEAFWRQYAEPVHKFVAAAEALRDIFAIMSIDLQSVEYSDEMSQISAAWARLNQLFLIDISPAVVLENARWQMRWDGPSLISHIAMMGSLELTRPGTHLKRCLVCRRMFTATSSKALYCSLKCRHTGQKRRQRKKRKLQEIGAREGERNDG